MNQTKDEPEAASLLQVGKESYVLYIRMDSGKMVMIGVFSHTGEHINGIWKEDE